MVNLLANVYYEGMTDAFISAAAEVLCKNVSEYSVSEKINAVVLFFLNGWSHGHYSDGPFSMREVLRPATSTPVFLGFPVSISKC